MIATIFFYIFAVILLASAAMVVSSRNPVHSVLFLILSFFNAAALFLIAGAEFLAMILLIVYVGAVAVLFLFVVMMLDVDFAELRGGFQRYLPVGATVGAVLFIELVLVLGGWKFAPGAATLRLSPTPSQIGNTAALGRLLYTDYVFLFQAVGTVAAGRDDRRDRVDAARPQDLASSKHSRADRTHGGGYAGDGHRVAWRGHAGDGYLRPQG